MRDLSERLLWAAEHAPVIDTAIHADIERAARARIEELEAALRDIAAPYKASQQSTDPATWRAERAHAALGERDG